MTIVVFVGSLLAAMAIGIPISFALLVCGAALMGGAVWICFFVGMGMGGHLFNLSGEGSSALLQVPPMIANH